MKKILLLLLAAVVTLSTVLALSACGKKTKLPETDYEKVVFAFEGVEKSFQKIGDKKTADLNDRAVPRLLSGEGDPLSTIRTIYESGDSQGDVIDELEYDQPPMIQFQCLKSVLEKIGSDFSFGVKYYDDMTYILLITLFFLNLCFNSCNRFYRKTKRNTFSLCLKTCGVIDSF